MKKALLFLTIIALVTSVKAQENARSSALKLNPLSLIVLTGNVAYEKAIGTNQSIQLGFFYTGAHLGSLKYQGFGVTPEYRIYIAGMKQALNGVYVAPFVRYQQFSISDDQSDKETFSSIGGGATLGWEKTWNGGFVLDIFAGPAYNSGKIKSESNNTFDVTSGINGFGVRAGITLGLAF